MTATTLELSHSHADELPEMGVAWHAGPATDWRQRLHDEDAVLADVPILMDQINAFTATYQTFCGS